MRNSLLEELRVRRFADIQEEMFQSGLEMRDTWVKVARMERQKKVEYKQNEFASGWLMTSLGKTYEIH